MDEEKKTPEEIEKEKKKNRAKASRQEKVKVKELTSQLKEMGTYREEFDETISTLAKKLVMMDRLWESLSSEDFEFSTLTAAAGKKGNPEANLFLNLSKSIETHQEKLGLTPSGYLNLTGTNASTEKTGSVEVSETVNLISSILRNNDNIE